MKNRWWVLGLVLFAAVIVDNANGGLFGRWASRRCASYSCATQCSQPAVQSCGSSYSSGTVVYSQGSSNYPAGTVVYAQAGDCGVNYSVPVYGSTVVSPSTTSSCGPGGCTLSAPASQGGVVAPSPMPLNSVAPTAPAPMPTPAVPPPAAVKPPAPMPTPAAPPAPVESKNAPPAPVAPPAPKTEPTPAAPAPPKPATPPAAPPAANPPATPPPPVAPAAAPSAPAAPPPVVPPPVVSTPKNLQDVARNAQDFVDAERREKAAKTAAEAKKQREQAKSVEKAAHKFRDESKAEIRATVAQLQDKASDAAYRNLKIDLEQLEVAVKKTETKLNDQISTLPSGLQGQAERAKEKIVAELKELVRAEHEKLLETATRTALKSVAPATGELRTTEFVAKDQAKVSDPNAPPTPTDE